MLLCITNHFSVWLTATADLDRYAANKLTALFDVPIEHIIQKILNFM
jgi:hypothetical protein